ncbi:unnamed protein product [Gulo gulo]|uniref:Uncharacterized protein n=1 Tax=Gulo gulo TaxID=48420 RepID=A0A9X9LG96_GULGU|nr:unnamed protein product [Gulo gulo]
MFMTPAEVSSQSGLGSFAASPWMVGGTRGPSQRPCESSGPSTVQLAG